MAGIRLSLKILPAFILLPEAAVYRGYCDRVDGGVNCRLTIIIEN